MKTLHDFIYCDGVLSTRTVFYLVKVGKSDSDRRAHAYVAKLARSPDFYFKIHSEDSMLFIEKCAKSIYSLSENQAVKMLRRSVIDICWLASFLRKNPAALLNSAKIFPAENRLT